MTFKLNLYRLIATVLAAIGAYHYWGWYGMLLAIALALVI